MADTEMSARMKVPRPHRNSPGCSQRTSYMHVVARSSFQEEPNGVCELAMQCEQPAHGDTRSDPLAVCGCKVRITLRTTQHRVLQRIDCRASLRSILQCVGHPAIGQVLVRGSTALHCGAWQVINCRAFMHGAPWCTATPEDAMVCAKANWHAAANVTLSAPAALRAAHVLLLRALAAACSAHPPSACVYYHPAPWLSLAESGAYSPTLERAAMSTFTHFICAQTFGLCCQVLAAFQCCVLRGLTG